MRIVTVNSHESYLQLLTGLPHDFSVVAAAVSGSDAGRSELRCWQHGRLRWLNRAAAAREAQQSPFDLVLAHGLNDLLFLQEFTARRVVLFHRTLLDQLSGQGFQGEPSAYVADIARCLEMMQAEVVFSSAAVADSWLGLSGRVIVPGLPVTAAGGYSGHQPAVLWVTTPRSGRDDPDRRLELEVMHGIPRRTVHRGQDNTGAWHLAGDTPGGSRTLHRQYRDHRCLFVSYRPEVDAGFDLDLLVAMAIGMPVVTTPHKTSPIRHGYNGLVGSNTVELRRHLVRLLHQPELARQLGAHARRTIAKNYPHAGFLSAWESLLGGHSDAGPWTDANPCSHSHPDLSGWTLVEGDRGGVAAPVAAGPSPRLVLIEGGRPA